ncbi:stage III sporulation protein AC [Oscillospiraceae bacterium OttesenSCG-928-G22]|nr:stage III sporulation protein AC [Oscillospiraceae bacterium OttesenSCG-928-G22]
MQVDLIFKIAAIGIVVAVINVLLSKSGRDEQALMVTIVGVLIVVVVVIQEVNSFFNLVRTLFGL